MANSNESIADVLAEMRADEIETEDGVIRLDGYADRIEAAAERERDEDRQLAAIAESDEAFARCARCDRPERAPGNAAAMREALTRIVNLAPEYPADGVDWNALAAEAFLTASAALAAPARNCDRFKTFDEARKAFQDLRGHKILADVELWDSMYEAGALVRWLFAPAEGGAE